MERFGETLRQERIRKGVSLEEMHKKTKIPMNILKALEEDNLSFLSPFYAKSYTKIYCKALGIDLGEVSVQEESVEQPQPKQEEESLAPVQRQHVQSNKSRVHRYTGAQRDVKAAFFTLLGQAQEFLTRHKEQVKKLAVLAILFLMLFLVIRAGVFVASRISRFIQKSRKPATTTQIPQQSQIPQDTSQASYQISEEALRLTIRARDDCWIKLKADDKVVFQSILPKGRSETWQAEDKIELSLGRPQSVDLEVNGKIIPNLGRRPKPLRNILITREGLIVPQ